ncbi:YwqH-like family protein [Peribacillus sp. NPDC097675]|uniref:YwqH-like family protein n=1 Tax=Peribacillus sp. NPDC097675 TaxID=3390618 RepID=UPI003CFFBCF0
MLPYKQRDYYHHSNKLKGLKVLSYLTDLQSELTLKKQQVEKLKTCKNELDSLQGEFFQNERLVTDPHLSSKTWHGTLATDFTDVRESLELAYKDLSQSQMNAAITAIENKIMSLQSEITSLETRITAEIERHAREEEKRRQEKLRKD